MEPNLSFNDSLIDNEDRFGDSFFQQFDLRHRDEPLRLNDQVTKNYLFPTFYADVSCAITSTGTSASRPSASRSSTSSRAWVPSGKTIDRFSNRNEGT